MATKTAVTAYDKNGNVVKGAYAVDGKTYKADGSRIDAGTSVVTNGGTFTYNGDGTSTKTSNVTPSSSRSSSGGGSSSSGSSDIGQQMQSAFNSGNYQSVLDLADQRSAKIDADSSLEQYRNQYNGIIEASRLALQQQPKQYENSAEGYAQRLADAQYNNKLAQLQKAYNNNMMQIQANETAQRNLASTQNQVANRNLATFMANNGLSNSGTNAQAMINSNGMLQNNMANIGVNAMNARNQALNALEQDSMSAYNASQEMLYNYLLEQEKANQDYGRQLSYLDYQNQLSQQNKVPVTYNGQTYLVDPVTALNFQLSMNKANGSYGSGSGSTGTGGLSYIDTEDGNGDGDEDEGDKEKTTHWYDWITDIFNPSKKYEDMSDDEELMQYYNSLDNKDKLEMERDLGLKSYDDKVYWEIADEQKNLTKEQREKVEQLNAQTYEALFKDGKLKDSYINKIKKASNNSSNYSDYMNRLLGKATSSSYLKGDLTRTEWYELIRSGILQ